MFIRKAIISFALLIITEFLYAQNNTTVLGVQVRAAGTDNTFVGYRAAYFEGSIENFLAYSSSFFGSKAGQYYKQGYNNTFIGAESGGKPAQSEKSSSNNTALGYRSGYSVRSGPGQNVFLGANAGYNTPGFGNVFIGYNSGYYEMGSNKLYIDNTGTTSPLIYGDFNSNQVSINGAPIQSHALTVNGTIRATAIFVNDVPVGGGQTFWTTSGGSEIFNLTHNVGIGTDTPTQRLDVNGIVNASGFYINDVPFAGGGSPWAISGANLSYNTTGMVSIGTTDTPLGFRLAVAGKVIAEEIVVKSQSAWPDFVFEPDYDLPSILEMEDFIKKNKHLKDVPVASEVEKNGIGVGEMNKILLQKIEEMSLYIIQLKKEVDDLKKNSNQVSDKR